MKYLQSSFRTFGPVVLVLGITLGLLAMPTPVASQSSRLQELQRQIKEKEAEANQKKKEADAEKKRQSQLSQDINKISTDITKTESELTKTEQDITHTANSVEQQKNRILDQEKAIQRKKDELREAVVEISIASDLTNDIDTFLGEDSITEAIEQQAGFDALVDQVLAQAEKLEKEREALLAEKVVLERQQRDLEAQKNQLAAYQRALDGQKNQKAALVNQSKQTQAQLISQSNEALKMTEELKKQFAKIANEEAARKQGSRAFSGRCRQYMQIAAGGGASASGYVVPTSGVITTCYGGSNFAQPSFHTGLDIASVAGTPILATNSGTVSYAGKYTGYGNTIDLRHDDGRMSRYAHLMQFLVLPGQRVERGQVIAYMGGVPGMDGAGWSTGAHLHFEIITASVPQDPLLFLP